MSDDQFTKLFKYMQLVRAEIGNTETRLKTEINRIYDLLDKTMKQQEIDEQERVVMNRQLDRHKDWIKQLGTSTRTKLHPRPD